MQPTVVIQNKQIRTDWISRIQRETENGTPTCTIWFSVGPVVLYTFKGKDAKAALQVLAGHPAL